jgi:hypothetical protein
MAKKLGIKTKLATPQAKEKTEKNKLNLLKDVKTYPRSYRWREYDLKVIENLLAKVNAVSSRKIDTTKLIRGALYIANTNKAEKLFNAVLEAEKNSMFLRD